MGSSNSERSEAPRLLAVDVKRYLPPLFPIVTPLYRADPHTLLTRPPLVSKKASFPLFPVDLHALGLPPAFNLSHDQTLQLKVFDAQRNRKLSYS